MSASATPSAPSGRFESAELDMLAKTADALSAYLGKPVLAEVGAGDDGMEWVTFGVPLDAAAAQGSDKADDAGTAVEVQMGGPGARLLGNRGGLSGTEETAYACLYLWGIQISAVEGERFVKLDQEGEASAWSDSLADLLPFALSDEDVGDDDDDDDENDDDDDDGGGDRRHDGGRNLGGA